MHQAYQWNKILKVKVQRNALLYVIDDEKYIMMGIKEQVVVVLGVSLDNLNNARHPRFPIITIIAISQQF